MCICMCVRTCMRAPDKKKTVDLRANYDVTVSPANQVNSAIFLGRATCKPCYYEKRFQFECERKCDHHHEIVCYSQKKSVCLSCASFHNDNKTQSSSKYEL